MIKSIGSKIKNNINYMYIIMFIMCFCLLVIRANNYILPGDNEITYAPGEINMFNNSLLSDNCDIKGTQGIVSPKYINQFILLALMKFGLSWAYTRLILILITITIFSIASINICKQLKLNNMFFCGLFFAFGIITNKTGDLTGFNQLLGNGSFGDVATAFSILGLSFCIGTNKKWFLAIICTCFSLLFHIHEGIYGLAVIIILWIVDCIIKKKFNIKNLIALIPWVVVASIVAIPSLISDTTIFSNKDFAEVYVNYRVPHHLLVFAWGQYGILKQLLCYIIPLVFLYIKFEQENKHELYCYIFNAVSLILCFFLVIVATLIFNNLYPISFFIKLYIPKFIKYVSIYFMIIMTIYINKILDEKKYFLVIYLMVTILLSNWMFVFVLPLLVMELMKKYKKNELNNYELLAPLSISLLFLLVTDKSISLDIYTSGVTLYVLVIFTIALICQIVINEDMKLYMKSVLINAKNIVKGMCIFMICLTMFRIDTINFFRPEYLLKEAATESIYNLSIDFKNNSTVEDVILVDPYNPKFGYIQIIAERNCFVLYKQLPSTEKGIYEWKKRLDYIGKLNNKSVDEVYNIMININYNYVLIEENRFEQFDKSNKFESFIKKDKYCIYKIK